MRVRVEDLAVEVAGAVLVRSVTVDAPAGAVVALVGPNGSGKSTTLRCAYRALRPTAGLIRLGDDDLLSLPHKETARLVGALPQEHHVEFDFTVAEVVAMGRTPHKSSLQGDTDHDREVCAHALAQVDAEHLAHRGFLTLSGGERQRVLIARALAQRPRVLVLDEPTNHLDIRHQLEVLAIVRATGVTALVALHDLNLAAAHCDLLHVLADGAVVASGPPAEVLTEELLAEVFGVRAHVLPHPVTGRPHLFYDTAL
ncbi:MULTISPECIES: ABC transporter ATP-binding protein [Actinosynnema]|uniref:ABC transporter ATP-binding protein n=1 Tax=Actinosynnema TaxID=40566 RepID=UPI0020A4A2EA|nr:ABC transporter ATP-binding protein [Actinosynnema pretiosum]MCP2092224.1 iron complex transport system ATP-binding protein [Actinosynnema pretiosum]